MLSQLAIIASAVTFGSDNIGIATASMAELALVVSNIWMLADACKKMKKTQNSLNEAYDELNISEEESIIDLKIVRQEGNELVEFFDFELLI